MSFRNIPVCRSLVVALIVAFSLPSLVLRPSAQAEKNSPLGFRASLAHHGDDDAPKKGLSRDQLIREAWAWHDANLLRLKTTHPLGADAITEGVISQDINDISVIQGDNGLVTSPNPFDLGGRQVQFTLSGSSYTITSAAGAFDTNVGTKLDLTTGSAVNPKVGEVPGIEPGDDAYITQDLGFNFNFYGATFSSVAITSNGNMVFRPSGVSQRVFDNGAVSSIATISEFQSGLPRIAPYWHDLDARASVASGSNGVFIRKDADRVLITWNNIRDFPNDPAVDRGVHRFQVTLFNTGRILFTYDVAQLTSQSLVGISPGSSSTAVSLVNLNTPPATAFGAPVGEFFSTGTMVDTIGTAQAFYASHPNRDVYDFIYLVTDFDFDLGGAFAFYLPLRNDASGIGQPVGQSGDATRINSSRIQGILNLSNLSTQYPALPTTRFLGANHALSIMGQEQGHRWLSYVSFPGADQTLLLGRDDAHWNFFMNIESTTSSPAAPRSSSMEGNVWRDNGNGSFTSTNLIDGFSLLDQYLMGLRPSSDVTDTFVIANPSNTGGRTRESNPRPNTTVNGTRQNISINQILQANGQRNPASTASPKSFRAAVVLLVRSGAQPSAATLNKVSLYRLAWESYFSQSTEFLATINTGLADLTTSRVIAPASAASFRETLAPGEISALFGQGLAGGTATATSQPLPTTLAGTQVRVDGALAGLFFVSPTQINFQAPRATAATTSIPAVSSATATIEVISNGQLIRAGAFQIAPAVPAVFTLNQSGTGSAAALDAFTNAREPFNAKQSNGQPNIIAVFGTGLGADATDVDGNVSGSVQATIDGNPVTVNYAGRAPGFTGLNQFNLVFPANITSGTHTLVISRSGIASRQVTIAVR
jgi:uncharacterized protein (TIGR03437 family)